MPPDILDYPTSSDIMVREGSNVSMRCAASGSPRPSIMWRREGGEMISNTLNGTGKVITVHTYFNQTTHKHDILPHLLNTV